MVALWLSPPEVQEMLVEAFKEKRLFLNLSQKSLAARSGVSYGVLKKFEATGQISLLSLLKLSLVLDSLNEFLELFKAKPPESFPTLDALLKQKKRHRGRK